MWGWQAMKAGLLSLREQPEGDKILGLTYEGDLRGTEDENGSIVPLCLTWEDIQNLKTDFFAAAIELYSNYSAFKTLPHGAGTQAERPSVLEAIKILMSEDNLWQIWKMEKRHGEERT